MKVCEAPGLLKSCICVSKNYQDIANIHEASLEILAETGLIIRSREALEIFKSGGAQVDFKNNLVKIPPKIVKHALDGEIQKKLVAIIADFETQRKNC